MGARLGDVVGKNVGFKVGLVEGFKVGFRLFEGGKTEGLEDG